MSEERTLEEQCYGECWAAKKQIADRDAENERLREALEKVLAADDDPNDKLTYLRSRTRVVIIDALRREET